MDNLIRLLKTAVEEAFYKGVPVALCRTIAPLLSAVVDRIINHGKETTRFRQVAEDWATR